MNVTLVEINIKPERVDESPEVFRANHEGALQEPGNLRFDVLQDPEVKTRFFIYEAYKDDEAVLARGCKVTGATAYFADGDGRVGGPHRRRLRCPGAGADGAPGRARGARSGGAACSL